MSDPAEMLPEIKSNYEQKTDQSKDSRAIFMDTHWSCQGFQVPASIWSCSLCYLMEIAKPPRSEQRFHQKRQKRLFREWEEQGPRLTQYVGVNFFLTYALNFYHEIYGHA